MYSKTTSAKVTKFITIILCIILFILMFTIIPLLKWYFGDDIFHRMTPTVVSFYACSPAAWIALFQIMKILNSVLSDDVFNNKTVKILRVLSYCCMYVSSVCIIGGFFSPAVFIFGLGSAFMMLILRVLKNVMETATEIKNENELTI